MFVLYRRLRKVRKVTTILQLTRALQYGKKSPQRSLEQRQELKLLQAASKESSLKKITEGDRMNRVKYCCYQCGLFLRGVISQWAHSCIHIHTYIHTLYFHSNYQSSSIELISSRKKIQNQLNIIKTTIIQ